MTTAVLRLSRIDGGGGYIITGMIMAVTPEDDYTEIERIQFCIVTVESELLSYEEIEAFNRKKALPYIPEDPSIVLNLDEIELIDVPQPPES